MINTYTHSTSFKLESGEEIQSLKLAYAILGNPEAEEVVWVCHALTGHPNVEDWWGGLFGVDRLFDFKKYKVICVNVIGSCYGSSGPDDFIIPMDFPHITVRDIVNSLDLLRRELKISEIDYLIGASLGGQQAIEWAIKEREVIKNLILVATNAVHSPFGIAFNESQRMALKADSTFGKKEGGKSGLKAARAIAMLSYRSYEDFEQKQTDKSRQLDEYRASSYVQYQGEKFMKRFSPQSYYHLTKVMDSHDVGRGRGERAKVLRSIKAKTLVIGVVSDLLFPLKEQEFLSNEIPQAQLGVIQSSHGHDAFLIEYDQLNKIIERFIKGEFLTNKVVNEIQVKCKTKFKTRHV